MPGRRQGSIRGPGEFGRHNLDKSAHGVGTAPVLKIDQLFK
jgi:hypothetical protein